MAKIQVENLEPVPEGPQAPERLEEGLLGGVAGLFAVANGPQAQVVDGLVVALDQRPERLGRRPRASPPRGRSRRGSGPERRSRAAGSPRMRAPRPYVRPRAAVGFAHWSRNTRGSPAVSWAYRNHRHGSQGAHDLDHHLSTVRLRASPGSARRERLPGDARGTDVSRLGPEDLAMMDDAIGALAIICIFGLPFIAWIAIRGMAHRERMEMIRNGMMPQQRLPRRERRLSPPRGRAAASAAVARAIATTRKRRCARESSSPRSASR